MTIAVCFRCGTIKHGAFAPCPDCAAHPQTEDEMALSVALTDHFFDMVALEFFSGALRDGRTLRLNSKQRDELVQTIRSTGMVAKLQDVIDRAERPQDMTGPECPSPKKEDAVRRADESND